MCGTLRGTLCCMVTRLNKPVTRRPSLPLTDAEDVFVRALTRDTPERSALARLLGDAIPTDASEGFLLHSLVCVAHNVIAEEVLTEQYAKLAKDYDDDEARRIARRHPLDA